MVEIGEAILKAYGIYKTRKLKENEIQEFLKIKKELEKKINMTIERLYLTGKCAWGKESEKEKLTLCILLDKRCKDIQKLEEIIAEYEKEENIKISPWSLCQFEKRKNVPTEEDYYIARYGIKVYDSGKKPSINENVKTTEYAIHMNAYQSMKNYIDNPNYIMTELIRLYILKIGYALISNNADSKRDSNFAKSITKDQNVIQFIDNFGKQTDEEEKKIIIKEFENYIKTVKQEKFPMQLEEKPTMKVYERLLKKKEKEGTLDIKTLTKEDLYTMYIIQKKNTFEIADLYGVENKVISSKRNNWHIKMIEGVYIDEELMDKITKTKDTNNIKYSYVILKQSGIMQFEECIYPILEYMMDDEIYLLREFWQFTQNNKEEISTFYTKTTQYYKASMCADLLLQNELVEETEYKQYKITQKGKDLMKYCYRKGINKINIPIICDKFKEVKYYHLIYQPGYSREPKEMLLSYINQSLSKTETQEPTENEFEEYKKPEEKQITIEEKIFNLTEIEYQKETVKKKKQNAKPRKTDFKKVNEVKIDFGKQCEEIIYQHEKQRLKKEGKEDLASQVKWISQEEGDGAGYDIESFENQNGTYEKIYIEVKGTDKKYQEPFDVTLNEIQVSEKLKDHYYIYRIGKVNTKKPEYYKIKGSITQNFDLTAINFKANKKK